MTKIIFWDFDGTLGYREGNWEAAIFELAANKATEANYRLVSSMLQDGFPWHHPERDYTYLTNEQDWWDYVTPTLARIFEALGFDKEEAAIKAAGVNEQYLQLSSWKLYEGAYAALEETKLAGWKNILVSNNVPGFGHVLQALSLSSCFEKIFISAISGFNKPNPLILQNWLQEAGNVSKIFVVGDRLESDIAFAENISAEGLLVGPAPANAPYRHFDNLEKLKQYILSY
ncbi:HAD family hydrolase [Foetidibacter luteolus]|uniref:HAD family hydrolase n=1 Tax=Foetidibacter luteolus TaxID=2608880 RepID=UPI00129A6F07|nr:HAD family hydrolase [Foetidibacter luteolus]